MDTVISSISVPRLLQHCGSASAPFVIDVRRLPTFSAEKRMIAGATWRDPAAVGDWLKFLPRHRDIAVYCVHGYEISKNTCAALRAAGLNAYFLEGGIEAAYRADLDAASDRAAKMTEIEDRLNKLRSPFRTAETFWVEEIIDPRHTRRLLCDFANLAAPLRTPGHSTHAMRP